MRIKILGSAAGGGFPQWNCNYRLSRLARQGDVAVASRLQSSIAASAGGSKGWVLFNASPDIRQQIADTPDLQPRADDPLRSTPIKAVVLTNADVDHIAGLLSLRERQPLSLYATRRVLDVLDANPIFRVLDPQFVTRTELPVGVATEISGPDGPTGIVAELFPVPGKVALYLESGDAARDFAANAGDTVGVRIMGSDTSARVDYVPGCAAIDDPLKARFDGSDVLLFDGTVFTDDEMARAGVGAKTGRRMGHMEISGLRGSLAALSEVAIGRRIYIHINNTNPILEDGSPEHRAVTGRGWEVARDGMEIVL